MRMVTKLISGRLIQSFLLCVFTIFLTTNLAFAAVYTVDDPTDGIAVPGDCEADIAPVGGDCSLADAIAAANDGGGVADVINFDMAIMTVTLTGSLPTIGLGGNPGDLVINGDGVTIDGSMFTDGRCMTIDDGAATMIDMGGNITGQSTVTINNLIFDSCGGATAPTRGGAIFTRENTIVNGCTFMNNQTGNTFSSPPDGGGAIFADTGATLVISSSTFNMNMTDTNGGAVLSRANQATVNEMDVIENDVTITNSTFTNNTSVTNGGALDIEAGVASIQGSTFSMNNITTIGGAIYNAGTMVVTAETSVNNNNATGPNGRGAGIANHGGELTVSNSTISGNNANGNGGGILNRAGGQLTVENGTEIQGNTADADTSDVGDGGGIYIQNGNATIDASTVNGNTAVNGGGIYNAGDATISNSLIDSNEVTGDGGGVFVAGGTVNIDPTTISNNNALSAGGEGGGIYQEDGEVNLECITIDNNDASADGGGIRIEGGALNANSTLLVNNTASIGGGMSATDDNKATVVNFVNVGIHDNIATTRGGGIAVFESMDGTEVNLSFTTVKGNEGDQGAGISNLGGNPGTVNLINSIFDLNLGSSNCFEDAVINDLGGNVSSDDTCSDSVNSLNNQNLMMEPLQDNGGCILTSRPMPGSMAIDFIAEEDCTETDGVTAVTVDARNQMRPDSDSGLCDSGYVERQPATGSITIVKDEQPVALGTNFGFTGTGFPGTCGLDGAFSLADGESETCNDLIAGQNYTVEETDSMGADVSIACNGGTTNIVGNEVTISLEADDTVTCTFTNTNPEICNNVMDDNGDGLADCADPLCDGVGTCEQPEATCDDTIDNDGDGNVDCDDTDCAGDPACVDADPDGDGIPNDMDNCPMIANPGQEDTDGDGVGDVCDNCPNDANADQADNDSDGVGNVCDDTPDGNGGNGGPVQIITDRLSVTPTSCGNGAPPSTKCYLLDVIGNDPLPNTAIGFRTGEPSEIFGAQILNNDGICSIQESQNGTLLKDDLSQVAVFEQAQVVCNIASLVDNAILQLDLCIEDFDGPVNANFEVTTSEFPGEVFLALLFDQRVFDGCDDGDGCSVAPAGSTNGASLLPFLIIPAIIIGRRFFRKEVKQG